ncbi:synaptic vesicle 2-related protein-like isoform X2 [Watersipora subatra]
MPTAYDMASGDLGTSQPFNISGKVNNSYKSTDRQKDESEETYEIEDAIEMLGYGRFQFRISCIAGLAWTADAGEMMVLAILSPALQCDWGLDAWKLGLITSIVFVGMMMGSSLWGYISDKYGRKFVLVLSSIFTMYFGVLSALSLTFYWLLIFRCLVGFCIAGGGQAVTLYSEYLPSKARAKSIVGIEVFYALGSVYCTTLALAVMPVMGWRWFLGFSAAPLLVFIILAYWMPESMRFNVARGHLDDASKTLKQIASENKTAMPVGRLVVPSKKAERGRLGDLFIPKLRITTLLLWFIWFANTFSYYGIVLLTTELLEIDSDDVCNTILEGSTPPVTCALDCRPLETSNYIELIWTALAEFPGLLLTFFIIDLIGRKFSMGLLFVMFALATALVAVCKGRILLIVFLFAARCFIAGAFQVAFLYATEIYPTNCRSIGLGTCSSLARIGAIITPFVAQVLLQKSIQATIGIYAGVAAAAAVASVFLPIETKGRQLEESH